MTRNRLKTTRAAFAFMLAALCLTLPDKPLRHFDGLFTAAHARIGRPMTPMSYAGVARRTTRSAAVATGAVAAGAAAYSYARPGCYQTTDAYGQLYWHC